MSAGAIRVLCVDDHALLMRGLVAVLHQTADITVVSCVATAEEAIREYRNERPDIVLMDLRLPGMTGFDAIRAIRREDPHARVIILTMYRGDEDVNRAKEAGACAYLLKDTLPDTLVHTIREVHDGRSCSSDTAVDLAGAGKGPVLSRREHEIIQLVAKGLRNKEIAGALNISQDTVVAHLRNIFTKLDVHDRTAALTLAIRRGIVHVD
jgi:DNA-binding NarL/FixJ family response regulator